MPYSEDDQDSQHAYVTQHSNGQPLSKAELRKTNKPIMEKKRRARINRCLNELKDLLLDAMKKDPARHSKLEKADILELTVKHLQTMQRQQLAAAVAADPAVLMRFRAGFGDCAQEVKKYISRLADVPPGLRHRLGSHLSSCISGIERLGPVPNDYPFVPNIDQMHFELDDTRRSSAFKLVKSLRPSPPISPMSCDSACDSSTEPETPPRPNPIFLEPKPTFPTPPSRSASDQDSSPETQKPTVSSTTISPETLKQMEAQKKKSNDPVSIVIDVENYKIGLDASPRRPVDYSTKVRLKRPAIQIQHYIPNKTSKFQNDSKFNIDSKETLRNYQAIDKNALTTNIVPETPPNADRVNAYPIMNAGKSAFRLVRTDEHAFKVLRSDESVTSVQSEEIPQNLVIVDNKPSMSIDHQDRTPSTETAKLPISSHPSKFNLHQNDYLSNVSLHKSRIIQSSNNDKQEIFTKDEFKNRYRKYDNDKLLLTKPESVVGVKPSSQLCGTSMSQEVRVSNATQISILDQSQSQIQHSSIRTVDIRSLQKPEQMRMSKNPIQNTCSPGNSQSEAKYIEHRHKQHSGTPDLSVNISSAHIQKHHYENFSIQTPERIQSIANPITSVLVKPVPILPPPKTIRNNLITVKEEPKVNNDNVPSKLSIQEGIIRPISNWNLPSSHIRSSNIHERFSNCPVIQNTAGKQSNNDTTDKITEASHSRTTNIEATTSKTSGFLTLAPIETKTSVISHTLDSASQPSSDSSQPKPQKELAEADTSTKSPERPSASADGMWRPW